MHGAELSRRRLLQVSTALGITSVLPGAAGASEGDVSSPDLEKFVQPVALPEVREPDGKRTGAGYHHVRIQEFERKVQLSSRVRSEFLQ